MVTEVFEILAKKYIENKDAAPESSGPVATPADIKKMGDPSKK